MTEREIAKQTPAPVLRELYALRAAARTLYKENQNLGERLACMRRELERCTG